MKKGFTLVELMIATSILSVGIVVILHSRLNVVSALDSITNQIRALKNVDSKFSALEEMSLKDEGIEEISEEESLSIGSRLAKMTVFSHLVEVGSIDEQSSETKEEIFEVEIKLSWPEGQVNKHLLASTYLPKKKQDE